jgi:hypothetical protein
LKWLLPFAVYFSPVMRRAFEARPLPVNGHIYVPAVVLPPASAHRR